METTYGDPGHPVTAALAACHTALDSVADARWWSMSAAETRAALVDLARLGARMAELELRGVAHADRVEVGQDSGAGSTAAWWAVATRQTRPAAHAKTRLAIALDDRWHRLQCGLAEGAVLPDQAHVIAGALEDLPVDLDRSVVGEAEEALVAYAADHDARALRLLGQRILSVVAPEVDEAHQARLLEADERRAQARARFTMYDDGHGTCRGRFSVDALTGAMLQKALLGLAAPKHQSAVHGTGAAERTATPERMGRAFIEYVQRYPADRLPHAGGVAATVVVTMTLADLTTHGSAPATLDTGTAISPGLARRLACEAGIVPVVLGGASQALDVGRQRRYLTEPQRVALALRDGGCTADGCDWPPGMCHAHHDTAWHRGGPTSLTNGRLLCPYHHARAHDPTYTMSRATSAPGAKVAFTRRT